MNTDPGKDAPAELYPNVAAVAAIYGDTSGKYVNFLSGVDEAYPAEPYFLWNQPLSDNGWVALNPNFGGNTGSTTSTNGNGGNGTSSGGSTTGNGSVGVVVGTISLATLSMFAAWLLA